MEWSFSPIVQRQMATQGLMADWQTTATLCAHLVTGETRAFEAALGAVTAAAKQLDAALVQAALDVACFDRLTRDFFAPAVSLAEPVRLREAALLPALLGRLAPSAEPLRSNLLVALTLVQPALLGGGAVTRATLAPGEGWPRFFALWVARFPERYDRWCATMAALGPTPFFAEATGKAWSADIVATFPATQDWATDCLLRLLGETHLQLDAPALYCLLRTLALRHADAPTTLAEIHAHLLRTAPVCRFLALHSFAVLTAGYGLLHSTCRDVTLEAEALGQSRLALEQAAAHTFIRHLCADVDMAAYVS